MKLTKRKTTRGNCDEKKGQSPNMTEPVMSWIGHSVMLLVLLCLVTGRMSVAQAVATTTVQGTVYLANGQPGAGTLEVSWPAFTTAAGKAVIAGKLTVTIGADGFMSVNLAPNLGATPAGLFYTAVYHMSDGTTSTEYWVIPATAQADLGSVRAQVMPAVQAVQAVSKAYVDQALNTLSGSWLSVTGGTMTGPLTLSGDPTQPLQATNKHYVDQGLGKMVPLAGGNMTGALTTPTVNGVQSPSTGSGQTTLQAAINAAGASGAVQIPPTYTGIDTFANTNGVYVKDWRTSGAQQIERSVKEFGAVCDGTTNDTTALQSALNYANARGVALTIPQGTCKTHTLTWRGETVGGLGKQVSALKGYPGEDVLATPTDSTNILSHTRLHDLTIYVDQSVDVSCAPAKGRAGAGSCGMSRPLESDSIFSPGGNGLTQVQGTGAGWYVGNCALAMPAQSGAGGNGLKLALIENVEIAVTGSDPLVANYPGAYSTHTCGMYLAQWPRWSVFRNIDLRGVHTGIAMPALSGTVPAGLNADSNRWENITIQAAHGFVAAAGSNNILDNVVAHAGNSSATGEAPSGLVLDLSGSQYGWTVRNVVVLPTWLAVQPALTVSASAGAVTAVALGTEHGLGFDPYGATVPVQFSGGCTAAATATVNSDGSIGSVNVTQGGAGCSTTTTASINVAGTWNTAAPVNLIGGENLSFVGGNLLKGNGGYTVWNATSSQTSGTQVAGGGGVLPGGGSYGGLTGRGQPGSALQVDQFPGSDFGAKLQACANAVSATYGGTCDARNFAGTLAMQTDVTIQKSNTAVLLPCATIATANRLVIAAGARNVALKGCALRGGSQADGGLGGSAIAYTGAGAAVQVGDASYATDTLGFHMDNVVINLTGSTSATAVGLTAYRTQEMDLQSLYFLGNANQTGMTLDGTGNYTGGTFYDVALNGFQTAVNAIGHQVANAATTDWVNASTFVRVHINCPTSGGSPIAGTYGINLQAGDGNTFTGGDVEGCATALHLGASAKNNTILGLRNENSTRQVVADVGSAYNNWITGGTMFTGALSDSGTRNSFLDTFHRSFNGISGDWYGSQQDATLTNHYRLGTGAGNERGLLDRYQTDSGYRWTVGLSDATAGEQFYQVLDELNSVYRISVGQYNNGQSNTNAQTVINAAGTGAVVLNGSNNAGTGGVVIGSGGPSSITVATIDKQGNTALNGTLQVAGTTTFQATPTVRNNADAEVDLTLWAGSTANQKEALIYKDNTGASQWYLVKDTANNLALNSAVGGLDSFKAYQSSNSGDTYVNAASSAGTVRINYETGSGSAFNVYGGNSSALYASFTGQVAIKFPGLAAATGHNCLQIDSAGYITNTGSGCGTNTTGGTTVSSGNAGQIAYYTANGNSLGGTTTVPIAAGGTGGATAETALANLNGISTTVTSKQALAGNLQAPGMIPAQTPYADIRAYGAVADGVTPIDTALVNAVAAACTTSGTVFLPCAGNGCYLQNGMALAVVNGGVACANSAVVQLKLEGKLILGSTFVTPDQMDLIGEGQGTNQTYQMSGAVAQIQAPAVKGTLGTAVSTTNAAVSVTPVFTSGSIANLPAGSALTIAGTTACAVSMITRAAGVVTATLSATCAIPAGTVATVAGVTDTSFNTTPMVTTSDYPAKTLTWQQSEADGTSAGGTVTGFNEATFETVRIQSVSGSTATAVFTHVHGAADQWGMVALAPPAHTTQHHGFENIRVTDNYGAGFWGEHVQSLAFRNMAFGETAAITSIPMEMASSSAFKLSRATLLPTLGHSCTNNCGQQGYPYGFRCTALGSVLNAANDGCAAGTSVIDDNSVIGGGIKLDTNGIAQQIGGLTVRDTTIEQPIVNALTEDVSAANPTQMAVTFDHVTLQDSFMGYGFSWINYLYPATTNRNTNGFVVNNFSSALGANVAGKYYSGRLLVNGADYGQGGLTLAVGRTAPVGTVADGSITLTELDGIGGALGPSLIPAATQSVTTDATTWICNNCTVRTGVSAPDGTATAAEITTNSGSGYTSVGGYTGTTAAGDCFIFGAWVRAGQNQKIASSDFGPMLLSSAGPDVFDQGGSTASSGAFQQNINGNWWHPVVALSCLTAGSATSHTVAFRLYAGTASGTTVGNQFWNPFLVYVPAASNVARDEVERWRQQLMHGVVPSGMPAGGGMLAINAAHKLYWGSDTNLYRSTAGVLKTDGALDVGTGIKCQGSYGSSGQVLSTTGSGCQWVAAGAASFTGDGVVLSNPTTAGAVTATLKPAQPNQLLAGPATGTQQATPSYRALTSADLPASINSNTTGMAAGLSGVSALPNGTTATTQSAGNSSTKLATTAYADGAVGVETARATAAEASFTTLQTAVNGALPANGCTTTSGGNLQCSTVTAASMIQAPAVASFTCTNTNDSHDRLAAQAAIDGLGRGGVLVLPNGDCYIKASSGSAGLTITTPISIRGSGQGSKLVFDLAAGMDRIRLAPTYSNPYPFLAQEFSADQMEWRSFTLTDGTAPGVYAWGKNSRNSITIDAGSGELSHFVMEKVTSLPTGTGYGVFMWNSTSTSGLPSGQTVQTATGSNGGLMNSTLRDNFIWGGIYLYNSGDTINVEHNQLNGLNDGVYISSISGAVDNSIARNNIVTAGCAVRLDKGMNFHLRDNEVGLWPYGIGYSATTATVCVDANVGSITNVDIDGGTIGVDQNRTTVPYPNLYVGQQANNVRVDKVNFQPTLGYATILNDGNFTCLGKNNRVAGSANENPTLLRGNGSTCEENNKTLEGLVPVGMLENWLVWSEDLTQNAWLTSVGGAGTAERPALVATILPSGAAGMATRLQLALNGSTASSASSGILQNVTGLANPHTTVGEVWLKSNVNIVGAVSTGSTIVYSVHSTAGAVVGSSYMVANAAPASCNVMGTVVSVVLNVSVTVSSTNTCNWTGGGNAVFSVNVTAGSAGQVQKVGIATPGYPDYGWQKVSVAQPSVVNSTTDRLAIQIVGGQGLSDGADILVFGAQLARNKGAYVQTKSNAQSLVYGVAGNAMVNTVQSSSGFQDSESAALPTCYVGNSGLHWVDKTNIPYISSVCSLESDGTWQWHRIFTPLSPSENYLLQSGAVTATPWQVYRIGTGTEPVCSAAPTVVGPHGETGDVWECVFSVSLPGDMSELYQTVKGLFNPNTALAGLWIQAKTGSPILGLGFIGATDTTVFTATSSWQYIKNQQTIASSAESWLLHTNYTWSGPAVADVYLAMPQLSFKGGAYVQTTTSVVDNYKTVIAACPTGQYATGALSAAGDAGCAQVAFSQLNGQAAAAQLPAATTSERGGVILPSGAAGSTLGTAAMRATGDFDAAGAAAAAQSSAQSFAANASNLTTGTLAGARMAYATPASCLAASVVSYPCIAYAGDFTGLGAATSTVGAATLYAGNAPANATLQVCGNMAVSASGVGTAYTTLTFTTPGGFTTSNAGLIGLTLGSAGSNGNCYTVTLGANTTFVLDAKAVGASGSPTWEAHPRVTRLH